MNLSKGAMHLIGGVGIKSVQFGEIELSGSGPTWDDIIQEVDTDKAYVVLLHNQYRSANSLQDVWGGYIDLYNSTTVRLTAENFYNGGVDLKVAYVVVEFAGNVSVQVAEATFTPIWNGGVEIATTDTISSVDTGKSFIPGMSSLYGQGNLGCTINVALTNPTTVTFTHIANDNAYSHTAKCPVVTFN